MSVMCFLYPVSVQLHYGEIYEVCTRVANCPMKSWRLCMIVTTDGKTMQPDKK